MGKGNAVRTFLGLQIQSIALLLLIGGMISPSDRQLVGPGFGLLVVGFVIYADENLSALKCLRDWIGCFSFFLALTSGIFFYLMIRGEIEFPDSLASFVLCGLLSFILLKLFIWVNKKYAASKKATVIAKTSADGQREKDETVGKVNATAPMTNTTQNTAPAQKQDEKVPNSTTIGIKHRAQAMSQEDFYGMIDAEAAELPPDEAECYTSDGQAFLLYTVIRALPQLETLCAPGFPGDRLLHAEDGAQAYDAMLDLVGSIRDMLKRFSRSQLQQTLSGVSPEDALLTWKAFRFYEKIMGGKDGFEELFSLLSDQV